MKSFKERKLNSSTNSSPADTSLKYWQCHCKVLCSWQQRIPNCLIQTAVHQTLHQFWDTFHWTEINNQCTSGLDATYREKQAINIIPGPVLAHSVLLHIDSCKHNYVLQYLCFILARVLPMGLHTLFFCKADKYPCLYIKCLKHWNF